ncbi:hypothetical protein [Flavobacterium aquidurense]|uniref:Uncharacterized protein n=1 Tax=Flavobacterium aquidurense TaxID=362413 RepID=A0A0Q0S5N3_9FLAO|nr:hypothetical protein [Flavobacterium aquidurense]KQB38654.1 hypothetical protein RC62_2014 [Flavobacterium aquidurense]
MGEYPKEIDLFHKTIESLKGIENVSSGIDNLEGIKGSELGDLSFSHLPIATLLRTDGGLKDEVILQFEFTLDKSSDSLISLEFLSWFVRDQSRGGEMLQLRTFALPPKVLDQFQIGETLKFHIDYFIEDAPESLQPILDKISKLNKSLELFIKLYEIPTKKLK